MHVFSQCEMKLDLILVQLLLLLSIIQMVVWVSLAKVADLRRSSRQPKSLFCKDAGWLQKRFLRTLYSGHVCRRYSDVIAPAAHGRWSVLPILNFVNMGSSYMRVSFHKEGGAIDCGEADFLTCAFITVRQLQ